MNSSRLHVIIPRVDLDGRNLHKWDRTRALEALQSCEGSSAHDGLDIVDPSYWLSPGV